jgi:hypothetical protein
MGVAAYPARPTSRSARYRYAPPPAAAAPAAAKARWGSALLPYAVALLVLAGVAAYAFAWPQSKARLSPQAPGTKGSLVWGDGLFQKRGEMKAWLSIHGASYQVWAATHPAALALIPRARR